MRKIIELNGFWRFLPELEPQYHPGAEYAQPGWDRRHWEVVPVPGCWNLYAERYRIYEGVAWFARSFSLGEWSPEAVGVLRFGAINYAAEVFVNGQLAGEHAGGYTEFTLDVSHLLHAGENTLAVRVDNRRHRILLPACLGWFNYGGIHRDVTLEVACGGRLDWVGVDGVPSGPGAEGQVRLRVTARDDRPLRAALLLRDPAGQEVWRDETMIGGGSVRELACPWRLPAAQPWSPASPALYTLETSLLDPAGAVLDRVTTAFGIRRVRTEGATILVNDEPIWLKGICYLEDHPAVGITYDERIARADLDDMAELGVNAIRCHVPLHERMLAECDRRGLLVWSEVPIYCLDPHEASGSAFSQPAYRDLAAAMLREMVQTAYNHPSIILWSLGNECKVAHPEAPAFFAGLAETIRGLDTTRLLSYASLYGTMGQVGELPDVIGVNEYWGWYDRVNAAPGKDRPLLREIGEGADGARTVEVAALDLSRLEQELAAKSQTYRQPLLLTEFGADAVPGYRAADRALWSEDYQTYFLQRTYEVLRSAPNVCGAFPFLYQDYPDPSKHVTSYWAGLNLKGIVGYNRERKQAYAALQEIYQGMG